MKRLLSIAAAAALCVPVLTSCSDDENGSGQPQGNVTVVDGLFVLNSGNQRNNIPGSLTYIGKDGQVIKDAFTAANGITLGDTPNDAVVYGSKLYITVTAENTVWVVDRSTVEEIRRISTTELMGEDKGKQPRRLLACAGKIYLSTFDGYVAAIDTADYTASATYKVGSYPEGMTYGEGSIFVANSDYGQGVNPSISRISLQTGEVTELKDELIMNPTGIVAVDNALYVLDYGSYDENWNQKDAGIRKITNGTVEKVADATMMAVDTKAKKIYTVNAPYTSPATPATYNVYDCATGSVTEFISGEDIASAAAITVDSANSGDVYISSYNIDPDTGFASYSTDGYINQYTSGGTFVRKYETGVGPTAFAFNYYTADE